MSYEHLLSPVTIRGKVYRNRMIAAPTLFAHAVYFIPKIRENVYRMVERRAAGGFAAVSTGELPVNFEEGITSFVDRPVDYTKYEGEDFEHTREYARRIQKHGALAYLEFCHEGSMAETKAPHEPWGPVAYTREDGISVRELNEEMMQKICRDFYNISVYAKKCGFDGVLLHGGHGFLLQQFISPWTNTRTDEYGGSIQNRARFPKMLLEAVRLGIGEDMVLELRFSAEDGVPGGMTIDDTVGFMKEIDGMADIIHVSNGLKWRGNHTKTFSSFLDIHGINVEYARKIKAAVHRSKVAVIGGLNDPDMCEEIIASGAADFVEFGRQGFADPAFPAKVADGRPETIRRCVRCFQCYPGSFEHPTDKPLTQRGYTQEQFLKIFNPAAMGRCAINPDSGLEFYSDQIPKVIKQEKLLVVGGGVGGMQAAITAAARGHKVTLIERKGRLGGTMNFTDKDDDKADLRNFKNLLIREATSCGADIRLNTSLTKALIGQLKPDRIIAAIGAKPVRPAIPGIEKAKNALEVYEHPEAVGRRVVLVGGGLVGCEVGIYLARQGREVTVIEMKKLMAPETYAYYRNALLEHMDKYQIRQYTDTRCERFEADGVWICQGGKSFKVPADTCIYSLGMSPDKETGQELGKLAGNVPVVWIGDCRQAGKLGDAVRGGYMAAMYAGTGMEVPD